MTDSPTATLPESPSLTGVSSTGALLGSIPVAVVYSFFVEHFVSGVTGSVKG